ncbi:amidohydrolase family protein [Allobranchiibius sp. GilTou38]|uniref:amidohydrolase family protein n=1 Tax=Allobranchiibius sp. GilTou38 TaxID=2815210 RepID=UPI001AA15AEA|nr:amidohydrolase family protein [Allobranchiibius sp. GilTou38]MBO1766748.1 amidohydrolase family protein [Allobranchiibius sp. GilTou38]
MKKTLITNAYVITMDRERSVLSRGQVLLGDDKILAVGHGLPQDDAEIIDARGGIVMPGFVDNHRHMWQTNLRAMLTDWTLHEYMRGIRFSISPVLRAEDIGAGNYIGALEALNAGVTTVFDYSHSNNSPEHASAGVEALLESGMRAVYGYGLVPAPVDHPAFTSVDDRIKDAHRIHDEYLSSPSALVTMGMALTETGLIPWSSSVKEITAALDMGVPQSIHNNNYFGVTVSQGVAPMHEAGLLSPSQIHVHCNTSTPDEFRYLADAGCTIVSTPDTEIQMGMGHPVFNEAKAAGIRSTVGCDIITLNGGDIVGQLRLGLQDARVRVNDSFNARREMPLRLETSSMDALAWGTINGAEALGLGSVTGSLEAGKQADVLIISGDSPTMWPINEEPGMVVFHSHPQDIDTVFVAGKAVKKDGRLVGVDYDAARRRAEESRDWIMDAVMRTAGMVLPPEESMSLISMEQTAVANMAC